VVDLHYENWEHHNAKIVKSLAEELEIADKPAPGTSLATDFVAWAEESNQVAREVVYPRLTFTENHREARINAEYVAIANPLARRRITLAGYRLAALLNATLGAGTPGPIPQSYPPGPPRLDLLDDSVVVPSKK